LRLGPLRLFASRGRDVARPRLASYLGAGFFATEARRRVQQRNDGGFDHLPHELASEFVEAVSQRDASQKVALAGGPAKVQAHRVGLREANEDSYVDAARLFGEEPIGIEARGTLELAFDALTFEELAQERDELVSLGESADQCDYGTSLGGDFGAGARLQTAVFERVCRDGIGRRREGKRNG
jgi:hypothetical protein